MDSTRQPSPPLELWLPEVQSYIARVTGSIMKQAGFDFSRSRFSYKRKNKKSQDELSFIFLSHFPVNYRISFQLEIWHPQIRQAKESFMSEIISKESNLCSIILFPRDFTSNDPDHETTKDYSVYNHKDLFMVGDWLSQTLQYELVPACNQFSSIQHMDSFFEAKPDWSVNTKGGGNICTDLITAKLNKRRDFHERYRQLLQLLNEKIEIQQMNPESRQLLTLCYETIR
jgi:hypothetical protein